MIDVKDDFFASLFRDLGELVTKRKTEMSAAEVDRAISTIATVAGTCGQAAAFCHLSDYTDEQTREFMRGVLEDLIETARRELAASPGKVH